MYLILNLMSEGGADIYRVISVLGYWYICFSFPPPPASSFSLLLLPFSFSFFFFSSYSSLLLDVKL
jgi:hypothetical protein